MTPPEPIAEQPRRKPRVRLWLVSLLVLGGGFVGRVVMEGGKPPDQGYPLVMLWQMGWYAAGLVVWFWWWSTQIRKEKTGCWIGIALAFAAVFAVVSSSPK